MPRPRPRRPTRGRVGAAVVATGVIALALSGCVGDPATTPTPTASSSTEPIFASDEEALAAAVEAYEVYRTASAQITADGGAEPNRIDSTVTPDYAVSLHEEFAAIEELGLTMVGSTRIEQVKLAEAAYVHGSAEVSIYFCRDVTEVRVIGPDGADVTPADRDNRTPIQAFLVSATGDERRLVVDGVELWSGNDFC
jgi:hypothetical protein